MFTPLSNITLLQESSSFSYIICCNPPTFQGNLTIFKVAFGVSINSPTFFILLSVVPLLKQEMSKPCASCSKPFKLNDLKVTCSECFGLHHAKCQKLSSEDVAFLSEDPNSSSSWRCSACLASSRSSQRFLRSKSTSDAPSKSSEQALGSNSFTAEHFQVLLNEIRAINSNVVSTEEKLSMKIDDCSSKIQEFALTLTQHSEQIEALTTMLNSLSTENAELKKKIATLENKQKATIPSTFLIQDKITRAGNIIVFGVNEASDTSSHDTILNIIRKVSPTFHGNFETSRLGSQTSSNKPRPIKVRFLDPFMARTVLRNKRTLLGTEFAHVKIQDDKSPAELQQLKDLRLELHNRITSGEKNITIKYVDGIPAITSIDSKN